MATFSIDFDRGDRKYIPGDTIQCKISVIVHSEFKARSLTVQWNGIAYTGFTRKKLPNGDYYNGKQKLFDYSKYLLRSDGETTIQPGTYDYTSVYTLSSNLPESFEHAFGHVRYDVTVNYDIPFGKGKKFSSIFEVIPFLDLNDFPRTHHPVKEMDERTVGCFCYESEPLNVVTSISKTGFVPGEKIPVKIEIANISDVKIKGIQVALRQFLTFKANGSLHGPCELDKMEFVSVHNFKSEVFAYQNRIFETELYLDPSFNFKYLSGCNVIDCKYFLETGVIVKWSGLRTRIPITIGTVPITVPCYE